MKVSIRDTPGVSSMLDYAVNVYKDDEFVICLRYEGYSGTAMQEEILDLRRLQYKPSEGYVLEW